MPNGVTILTPCAPIIRAIADAIVFPVISSSYAFLLSGMKKSLFPRGNKDRKYNFCGTTLFAGKTDRSFGANTPCAL